MRLYQIEKLLNIKRNNQQSEETAYRTGENFAIYSSSRELILDYINNSKQIIKSINGQGN
jgi:hypothetical protein